MEISLSNPFKLTITTHLPNVLEELGPGAVEAKTLARDWESGTTSTEVFMQRIQDYAGGSRSLQSLLQIYQKERRWAEIVSSVEEIDKVWWELFVQYKGDTIAINQLLQYAFELKTRSLDAEEASRMGKRRHSYSAGGEVYSGAPLGHTHSVANALGQMETVQVKSRKQTTRRVSIPTRSADDPLGVLSPHLHLKLDGRPGPIVVPEHLCVAIKCGICLLERNESARIRKQTLVCKTCAEVVFRCPLCVDNPVRNPWAVRCDSCRQWYHDACLLFNRHLLQRDQKYFCPRTTCKRKEKHRPQEQRDVLRNDARDIPETALSSFLTDYIKKNAELPVTQLGRRLSVKLVSNVDREHFRSGPSLKRYPESNDAPAMFMVKEKVILAFQEIDGRDVCFFSMFVDEIEDGVNKGRVIISDVDCNGWYQEAGDAGQRKRVQTHIIHGYMQWAQDHGFNSVSFWASPRTRVGPFFFDHPESMRVKSQAEAFLYFRNILGVAERNGIVSGFMYYEKPLEHFTGQCMEPTKIDKVIVAFLRPIHTHVELRASPDIITSNFLSKRETIVDLWNLNDQLSWIDLTQAKYSTMIMCFLLAYGYSELPDYQKRKKKLPDAFIIQGSSNAQHLPQGPSSPGAEEEAMEEINQPKPSKRTRKDDDAMSDTDVGLYADADPALYADLLLGLHAQAQRLFEASEQRPKKSKAAAAKPLPRHVLLGLANRKQHIAATDEMLEIFAQHAQFFLPPPKSYQVPDELSRTSANQPSYRPSQTPNLPVDSLSSNAAQASLSNLLASAQKNSLNINTIEYSPSTPLYSSSTSVPLALSVKDSLRNVASEQEAN